MEALASSPGAADDSAAPPAAPPPARTGKERRQLRLDGAERRDDGLVQGRHVVDREDWLKLLSFFSVSLIRA